MEWIWIAIPIAVVIVIIIIAIASSINHDRGDYNDGGGTQIGGSETIPLLTPENDRAGLWGEKVVNYHLRLLLRKDEYLLANLLLPLRNGHKAEIDCVLITRKGMKWNEKSKRNISRASGISSGGNNKYIIRKIYT